MAGSLRKFRYTSDDGNVYGVLRDESNTEAVNVTDANVGAVPIFGTNSLPDGYTPRYAILYRVTDPQQKRTVMVTTPAVFEVLGGGTDYLLPVVGAAPANFRISSLIGEKREGLTNTDTGQNDGDEEAPIIPA